MQFISFCLFTIIFGYSLVISAPVNHTVPITDEAKHQKATEIASRLLKEIAGEQTESHHLVQSTSNEENKDTNVAETHSKTEKVEPLISTSNDESSAEDESEELELMPTIDEVYEIYNNNNNKYAQVSNDDDDESSSETLDDGDYFLPISRDQLVRYLANEDEHDEHLISALQTQIMDDRMMTAENHQQQRRRRSVY
ncbi:unnamed protein product [Adineta steineri]|uniref:Uncharacterized protein n=1 Tax=Adineta steineri TaxID=433720 RepID=A0A813TTS2_9BILA|nr:unnamed protein product [Adineta steineri]CAF0768627.1 unnamed protein product [Adineta steineri]CAF0813843.1 unnamed protein product [Adineta steineri]